MQGSSLRIDSKGDLIGGLIGDLDVAIKVDAATFDKLITRFKDNTTSSGRLGVIEKEAAKGKISGGNMFLNTPNSSSITGKFYGDFQISFGTTYQNKFNVDKIQISVILNDSRLDISPFLKIK